ncbi:MAG: hypothetical protein E7Z80_04490 [Methanobrevibacter thaueri]|nr:hypothetical protein [Methanobrevibacter thaueri]
MDLRKIGVLLIFVGIVLSIVFIGNEKVFVPALTVTVFGFLITVIGFLVEVRKRRVINERLDEDIGGVLQPLITKYSNLNKEYKMSCGEEEYFEKRLEINRSLEAEISESLPYLSSREVKKIVIQFSQEQDKL